MSMLKADRPSLSKANALKNIRSDQELMHINVVTTKEFHKEMKHYAVKHDITLKELIHKSLKAYMK